MSTLNLVISNCEGRQVELEYKSLAEFFKVMDSEDADIPMLDDTVVTLDVAGMSFNEESLSDIGVSTVKSLCAWLDRFDDRVFNAVEKISSDDLYLEAELVEDEGSYYHMSLMGYDPDDLRLFAERKVAV